MKVLTNLLFNVCRLVRCCSGQDAGVGEAGLEKGDDHKYKEDSSDNRYAAGQVFDQEWTATDRERMNYREMLTLIKIKGWKKGWKQSQVSYD